MQLLPNPSLYVRRRSINSLSQQFHFDSEANSHSLYIAPFTAIEDSPSVKDKIERASMYSWLAALRSIRWRTKLTAIGFAILYVTFGILFIKHYKGILTLLELVGLRLREYGILGAFLVAFLIFISSFPLVPGYGTLTTFAGFVYGFPLGFVPAFIGALSGATTCFTLGRLFGQNYAHSVLSKYKYIRSIIRAVNSKGIKLLILIRLAPYPYNLMNIALTATSVSTKGFVFATAVSLIKLSTHTIIGANLDTLHDTLVTNPTPLKIFGVVCGVLLGLGIMVYIYWLTRKAVAEMEDKETMMEMEDGGWAMEDGFAKEEVDID